MYSKPASRERSVCLVLWTFDFFFHSYDKVGSDSFYLFFDVLWRNGSSEPPTVSFVPHHIIFKKIKILYIFIDTIIYGGKLC